MPITEEQLRAMDEELDKQFAEEPVASQAEPTEQESTPDPVPPVVEQPTPDTPSTTTKPAEDKAAHAFEQMRKKNKELEEKANAERERIAKLEALAKKSGFSSIDEMEAALQAQIDAAEAKQRNSDPTTIKELRDTKARLDAMERERVEQQRKQRMFELSTELEKLRTAKGLTQDEMTNVLTEMETEGYTVDSLLSNPNKTIIRMVESYATPIILEKQVQSRLSKLQKDPKVPTDKPATTTTAPEQDDWKKLLDEEMRVYKKENYPHLK